MPGTSMSLHYWQPAPGWRLLPCLANPGNPAANPMWKMKEQALTTLINKQCKKMREGKTSNNSYCHTLKQWPMPNKKWEAQHSFMNALHSDNNGNTVFVLGHKYVLGPSQGSFQPSPRSSG